MVLGASKHPQNIVLGPTRESGGHAPLEKFENGTSQIG